MEDKASTPYINVDYFENLTGEIAASEHEGGEEIGARIRVLRKEKGLSIENLAEMTGFDADLLARIENREVYPQLGAAIKLSRALAAALGRVLSGGGDQPYVITRVSDRKVVSRSTSADGQQDVYAYIGLAPQVQGRKMEPLIVQLTDQSEREISRHQGEEFIFVLSGVVLLEIDEQRYELEPGDSAYYQSNIPHWLGAQKGEGTILAVIYDQ